MKEFFALQYANAHQWIGRFAEHWGRTSDIDGAALFGSHGEAEIALAALLQEGKDRLARSKEDWPTQFWWDICGGAVTIERIEVIARHVGRDEQEPTA